jgi:hypothetical protein
MERSTRWSIEIRGRRNGWCCLQREDLGVRNWMLSNLSEAIVTCSLCASLIGGASTCTSIKVVFHASDQLSPRVSPFNTTTSLSPSSPPRRRHRRGRLHCHSLSLRSRTAWPATSPLTFPPRRFPARQGQSSSLSASLFSNPHTPSLDPLPPSPWPT